jgi:hypothetical protein
VMGWTAPGSQPLCQDVVVVETITPKGAVNG